MVLFFDIFGGDEFEFDPMCGWNISKLCPVLLICK